MTEHILTPLQLVEVGRRLSEATLANLGLLDLISDARLVVEYGLRGLTEAGDSIGIPPRDLEDLALGVPRTQAFRFAARDPKRMPHSYQNVPMGPPGTVLTGKKQTAGEARQYAFVFRDGVALLLGDDQATRAYGSLTGLARAAGFEGRAKDYWIAVGRCEPGARLRKV